MAESKIFRLTEQAMRAELNTAALAEATDEWPRQASGHLLRLSRAGERFKGWPDSFVRSHRVLHATVGYYTRNYWRVSAEMPILSVNPSIPQDERLMVAHLAETILFTRVAEKPTGNTVHPHAPTRDDLRAEWRQVHQELGGGSEPRYKLSHATWHGVITALIDGQVRVGPARY